MEIQPGMVVEAESASGSWLRRRALTGVTKGMDFPVVWTCSEREWSAAGRDGRAPEGLPWPADAVRPTSESDPTS
jgi:hypothetical protein